MPKLATGKLAVNWGWLVYRIVDGEAEFLGLYQTREAAERDVAVVSKQRWVIERVPLIRRKQAAKRISHRKN
jgi:transposase